VFLSIPEVATLRLIPIGDTMALKVEKDRLAQEKQALAGQLSDA
jgi:hypothetical protein